MSFHCSNLISCLEVGMAAAISNCLSEHVRINKLIKEHEGEMMN